MEGEKLFKKLASVLITNCSSLLITKYSAH